MVASVHRKARCGPKRVLIALLAAAAGFTLCLRILEKSDPLMALQDVYSFSVGAGVLSALIAWKFA